MNVGIFKNSSLSKLISSLLNYLSTMGRIIIDYSIETDPEVSELSLIYYWSLKINPFFVFK